MGSPDTQLPYSPQAAGPWLILLLAGCVSGGGVPDPASLMPAVNGRFAGGPVSAVVARYGQPHSQFTADSGVKVLEWHATNTLRFHEPVTTTTTGTVGSGTWTPPVPYQQTTTTRQGYSVDYACTMQVGVRADGTVEAIGFNGKMGACQNFLP